MLSPTAARQAAERAEQGAERAAQGEYPHYGRSVYVELAQAYRHYADVVEQTESADSDAANDYQAKRQRRVARLKRRAAWTRVESLQHSCQSHDIASRRPFGQPILVGHYSEKRHRSDLRRQEAKDRKSHGLWNEAEELERRAKAAETNRAISSDDPEAVAKLKAKVAKLEADRELYKQINAEYRKLKGDIDAMMTVSDALKARMKSQREEWYMGADNWKPFDGYVFQNMGADIRRLKDRIEELERRTDEPEAEPVQRDGFRVLEDADWGRVLIEFDGKPAQEVRAWLKSQGWRWARSRCAWVRHLNAAGRYAAQVTAEKLPELLGGD